MITDGLRDGEEIHRRGAYQRFRAAFTDAASVNGLVSASIVIDGRRIDIDFAGSALARQFLRPMAHLLVNEPAQPPELRILVWDSASSGVRVPFAPETVESFRAGGFPAASPSDEVLVSYGRPSPGLAMMDLAACEAVYAVPSATHVPYGDVGGPFVSILNWWATRRGYLWVHGGVVGTDAGGAIITGPSGSGKSTTCLACLQDGMQFVGDDYCLLKIQGGVVTALSLYSTGKVRFANLRRLPGLASFAVRPDDVLAEKGVVFAAEYAQAQVRRSLAVSAVVFPESKGHPAPVLGRMPPAKTLAALAPTSLLQLSASQKSSLAGFAEVARRVPGFRLMLAEDTARNPALVREAIERGRAGAA